MIAPEDEPRQPNELIFRFSSSSQGFGSITHLLKENHAEAGSNIMRNDDSSQVFNDFDFYKSLCENERCLKVEIASICVRHNRFCHGFQVIYRSTFADGTTRRSNGPKNFFAGGYYAGSGGKAKNTWVRLEDGEFIAGLRINQGEILDGITFVTNRREIHCGGRGGGFHTMGCRRPSMRMVALTGTVNGVEPLVAKVGYYAKSVGWEIVGPFILLRQLVNNKEERAAPIDYTAVSIARRAKDKRSLRIQATINELIALPDGVFQIVLQFLI